MSRTVPIPDAGTLQRLLQLASPALPVGAYSYSEGLEFAVETGRVTDATALRDWLESALRDGGAGLEAALLVRAYDAARAADEPRLRHWDAWLTAARESEELRLQNLEMGRALLKLFLQIESTPPAMAHALAQSCNFVVAFALAAAHWRIPRAAAAVAYLHAWAANLVGAGVKLIPLGQTAGQRLLWELQPAIDEATQNAAAVADDDLGVANWGQALASMRHETQYSRLFRS